MHKQDAPALRQADPAWDKYAMETYPADCCCPFGEPETVGYVKDNAVLGMVIMSNVFLAAAITSLALREAGCGYLNGADDDNPPECTGTVRGMRPTNIVPYTVTVAGLVVAMLMPVTGSVIDHTPYRKQIAAYSGAVVAVVSALQAIISADTWWFVVCLQIVSIGAYVVHQLASGAYLPELGTTQNESTKAAAWSSLGMFATQLGYTLVVSVLSIVLFGGTNNVKTAMVGQLICGASVGAVMTYVYARLMRTRNQTQLIPDGQTAFTAGLHKLWATTATMRTDNPGTAMYLVGMMFTEAAMSSFASLGGLFIQVQLGGSGVQVASVIATLLIVATPSSALCVKVSEAYGRWYGDDLGARRLLCTTLLYLFATTLMAPVVLTGPETIHYAYLFAVVWGLGFGFYYSLNRAVYVYIIPGGEEAKYIGVNLCASNLLGWLPPLIFSQLNRALNDMRIGLVVLAAFFPIGTAAIASIDMKDARGRVVGTLAGRAGAGGLELRESR